MARPYPSQAQEGRSVFALLRVLAIVGGSGLAMAQALLPRYAAAQTISFTDERIKATYVDYPSPGGTAESIRGYLVRPAGEGPFPAVLIIHENRGLNPYIEDVARRAAVAGFLAATNLGKAGICFGDGGGGGGGCAAGSNPTISA